MDRAPLLEMLRQTAAADRQAWHMPGHLNGLAFPAWFSQELVRYDLTELPATDDLNHPAGPARQAMALAAAAYGAGLSRFITGGSTAALYIMLAAFVGRGKKLLVSRVCHQAVMHAAALLDLQMIFIENAAERSRSGIEKACSEQGYALFPAVQSADIVLALQTHPDCRAVLITSPDYYGQCSDLAAIARIAHRFQAVCLVDEAHGAHLHFAPDQFPADAMTSGADACVQSWHKTLPALTQGACLHIAPFVVEQQQYDQDLLNRLIPMFQTSSPSFLIAASLDYARSIMVSRGCELLHQYLQFLADFRSLLPDDLEILPTSGQQAAGLQHDPLHLVISSRQKPLVRPACLLASQLTKLGADVELADLTRLVLFPSLFRQPGSWQQLARTLDAAVRAVAPQPEGTLLRLENSWRRLLITCPERVIPVADALLSGRPATRVPLTEAAGQVAGAAVTPYPPGIPLFWPGERFQQESLEIIRMLLDNGISISGLEQEKVLVLKV